MASSAETRQLKLPAGRTKTLVVVLCVVGAIALAAAIGAVSVHLTSNSAKASGTGSGSGAAAGATSSTSTTTPPPPPPLTVAAVSPTSGATNVATNAELTVTYSQPLTGMPPTPTLNPAIAGNWTEQGDTLVFDPTGGWLPYSTETVTIPAGATAKVDGTTISSTQATTASFTVQAGSQARLEQMLAELGYLPFNFQPAVSSASHIAGASSLATEATQADAVDTSTVPGSLAWSWSTVPPTLSALWAPGRSNTLDKGAIMAFQSVHDLKMDGVAGPSFWSALVSAVAARQSNPNPYDYLVANETLPEKLTVWRNGQVIYTTLSNTGVPGATTQPGTYPVYLRYQSTTMTGTDVDGTKYVDPGIPWVAYFNGGDAVHGYVRGSYGYPQSNGCVELPVSNAAQVWTMDPYGTLVTVTPA